ncbi:unnamed protein product [Mytilus coruscus]|uniref:C-type lectin domain-containing protein n=1 Tax=Mytilus coruscus TaxID=42192 RepID=A0A6J8ADF7_MYTCO|nr:unnamed protein product [Mytilus coruscus]
MLDFPKLTLKEIRDITMGVYQLKLAARYTESHINDDNYTLQVCKDRPNLLRVKLSSRHLSSKTYSLWIEYSNDDITFECDLPGYDYDVSSRTCLKFISIQLNWYDARQQCIGDGGDLITVETVEKLYFHKTSLNNCSTSQFYWIGLSNGTWTSGESFQDIYGLEPTDIRIAALFPGRSCGRLRFSPGTANLMYDTNCYFLKEFVCELNVSV